MKRGRLLAWVVLIAGAIAVAVCLYGHFIYRSTTPTSTMVVETATIDAASLEHAYGDKTISGTASVPAVRIVVVLQGRESSTYKWDFPYINNQVPVTNGRWLVTIPEQNFGCNPYDVEVFSGEHLLKMGTFDGGTCGD